MPGQASHRATGVQSNDRLGRNRQAGGCSRRSTRRHDRVRHCSSKPRPSCADAANRNCRLPSEWSCDRRRFALRGIRATARACALAARTTRVMLTASRTPTDAHRVTRRAMAIARTCCDRGRRASALLLPSLRASRSVAGVPPTRTASRRPISGASSRLRPSRPHLLRSLTVIVGLSWLGCHGWASWLGCQHEPLRDLRVHDGSNATGR